MIGSQRDQFSERGGGACSAFYATLKILFKLSTVLNICYLALQALYFFLQNFMTYISINYRK